MRLVDSIKRSEGHIPLLIRLNWGVNRSGLIFKDYPLDKRMRKLILVLFTIWVMLLIVVALSEIFLVPGYDSVFWREWRKDVLLLALLIAIGAFYVRARK